MSGPDVVTHPVAMTAAPTPTVTAGSLTSLFLVELRAATGVPTDLNRMHRDLTSAINRLAQRGVDITGAGSYFLPEDARCLCLVRCSDKTTVGLACDTAGLSAAPVYEAQRLPDQSSQRSRA